MGFPKPYSTINKKWIERCVKYEENRNRILTDNLNTSFLDELYDELYKEISDILGIYSYTKDKKNIKPYIIIGKDLE